MPVYDFDGEFLGTTRLVSKSVALNIGETIMSAKLVVNESCLSNPADFAWYVTADGGTTWESTTINTTHNFTNTGNDLKYKVDGASGSTITVRQSDGDDLPIKVIYNE
jgi:hypothetical protein